MSKVTKKEISKLKEVKNELEAVKAKIESIGIVEITSTVGSTVGVSVKALTSHIERFEKTIKA